LSGVCAAAERSAQGESVATEKAESCAKARRRDVSRGFVMEGSPRFVGVALYFGARSGIPSGIQQDACPGFKLV
jgi:hypothetical protein